MPASDPKRNKAYLRTLDAISQQPFSVVVREQCDRDTYVYYEMANVLVDTVLVTLQEPVDPKAPPPRGLSRADVFLDQDLSNLKELETSIGQYPELTADRFRKMVSLTARAFLEQHERVRSEHDLEFFERWLPAGEPVPEAVPTPT